jgi:hypothetical protein
MEVRVEGQITLEQEVMVVMVDLVVVEGEVLEELLQVVRVVMEETD